MIEHLREGDMREWIKMSKESWSSYPIGTMAKQDTGDEIWTKINIEWQAKSTGAMYRCPPYCKLVLLPRKEE